MRRGAWAAPLALAMVLQGAAAEQAGGNRPLDDNELLGMRLFNQSCRVCHTKPQMTSPLYGLELSRDSAGGQDTVMREVISNGTPRMPGFKFRARKVAVMTLRSEQDLDALKAQAGGR